ncbi:MAG: 2TM domain-containing protein [Thermodesulfobacteriota bacterium]
MEDQELYRRAEKRVAAKIGFYIHLFVYLGVNALLLVINLTASPESLWFYWPLLGWGIGLFFHGLGIFVFSGPSSWKAKMIQKEMEKER